MTDVLTSNWEIIDLLHKSNSKKGEEVEVTLLNRNHLLLGSSVAMRGLVT